MKMTMRQSFNSIDQICRKAVRGAGLPWGVADEVGKAVRAMHCYGLNGVRSLARLLNEIDHKNYPLLAAVFENEIWRPEQQHISPTLLGPALRDFFDLEKTKNIRCESVLAPDLLIGFLILEAKIAKKGFSISFENQHMLLISDQSVTFQSGNVGCRLLEAKMVEIEVVALSQINSVNHIQPHVDIFERDWKKLEQFASFTYVMATEQSRLKGAGAGTSDND